MKSLRTTLLGAASAILLSVAVLPAQADDRVPTAEEHIRIAEVLRSNGYVSWKEIEFDDGRWEIDDARRADGTKYDVKVDPKTHQIISADKDD